MNDLYIAEIPGTISLPLTLCLCRLLTTAQRSSRLFEVTKIGINRKQICDFLLVFHCNYKSTFYRFRDRTVEKSALLPFSPTTGSFEALVRGFTWDLEYESWFKNESLSWKSHDSVSMRFVTGGQTDGRTDEHTNRETDRRMDGQTDRRNGHTDGRIDCTAKRDKINDHGRYCLLRLLLHRNYIDGQIRALESSFVLMKSKISFLITAEKS